MAEGGKVHADLMRAPGARRDAQERAAVPLGKHGIVRDGRLTAGRRDAPVEPSSARAMGRSIVPRGGSPVPQATAR